MPTDPTLFWMSALIGLGAFTAWLVKKLIEVLERNAAAWRDVALKGASTAEKAARLAVREDE